MYSCIKRTKINKNKPTFKCKIYFYIQFFVLNTQAFNYYPNSQNQTRYLIVIILYICCLFQNFIHYCGIEKIFEI